MSNIKKTEVKFRTTDGSEFDTEKEAEKHEELYQANEAYDTARRRLGKLLAETQKTADGKAFEFGIYRDYYFVTPGYWSWPALQQIPYLGWSWQWDNSGDKFTIFTDHPDGKRLRFEIGNLYADKRLAEKALLEAREKRIAELHEEMEQMRAQIQ